MHRSIYFWPATLALLEKLDGQPSVENVRGQKPTWNAHVNMALLEYLPGKIKNNQPTPKQHGKPIRSKGRVKRA